MKKVIAVLLAVSMLWSFCITSFAAGASEDNVLRFNKNGTFKILVLADVQDGYPIDDSMIAFINEALDYAKPDLVVFDGDNIMTDDVRAYEQVLTPLVKRGVPFSLVFGNHDPEVSPDFPVEEQLAEYQKYDGCLAYDADPALRGCANHNLLIYSSKGNDIAFNLWFFDSGTSLHENGEWLGYDWVREDQIKWYQETRDEITAANGGKIVHSIAFQHIIPKEAVEVLFYETDTSLGELTYNFNDGSIYSYVPKIEKFDGYIFEKSCCGFGSDGQWDAMLEGGDVLAVVVGHDHVNSFVADINGIDLVQTPGATYHSYYNNMLQGARIIELDEGDLDSYYTYELTSSFLASQSGSTLADGGTRTDASYTFANIMRPVFDMIMELIRDIFGGIFSNVPEADVPTGDVTE